MSLQKIRTAIEVPIKTALQVVAPSFKVLTENQEYAENSSLSEFALVSISFGLMTESSLQCELAVNIRASLVVTIYSQKGKGPGRAQQLAEAVIDALVGMSDPTATPAVSGVRAYPTQIDGPTFTPMEGRPHIATRITAPIMAKVTPVAP